MKFEPKVPHPSLVELAKGHRRTADHIRRILTQYRKEQRETDDPEEKQRLKARINMLMPILTENNKMAEMLERYFDKTFLPDPEYCMRRSFNRKCNISDESLLAADGFLGNWIEEE